MLSDNARRPLYWAISLHSINWTSLSNQWVKFALDFELMAWMKSKFSNQGKIFLVWNLSRTFVLAGPDSITLTFSKTKKPMVGCINWFLEIADPGHGRHLWLLFFSGSLMTDLPQKYQTISWCTPSRTLSISGLKSRVLKLPVLT